MPHLEPESCHTPPVTLWQKPCGPLWHENPAIFSLSSDLIPIRKPHGSPCRIVVNRDPFRRLGFRETLERRCVRPYTNYPNGAYNTARCRQ